MGWRVLLALAGTLTLSRSAVADTAGTSTAAHSPVLDDMVMVPAGSFLSGCHAKVDAECDEDEAKGHRVELAAFSIDRTEVTVAAYRSCVEAGACSAKGLDAPFVGEAPQSEWAWACTWGKPDKAQHPINCVDWSQAKAFCAWVGKRLPREDEWEKAARGSDGRKYPWGNEGFGKRRVANVADATGKSEHPDWTVPLGYDDGFVATAPVGSFPAGASPYGALDMIGNVWEWSGDWFNEGLHPAMRGGAWMGPPQLARASARSLAYPNERNPLIGFRCAK